MRRSLAFDQLGAVSLRSISPTEIESVALSNVNDEGMRELCNLRNLRTLDIQSPYVTPAGLVDLGQLQRLEALTLTGARIRDRDLFRLRPLKKLRWLNLDETQITAEGVAWIQRTWPGIELATTRFPSAPEEKDLLRELAQLNCRFGVDSDGFVQRVTLLGRDITDEHLLKFASLSRLTYVDLYDTSVTGEGVSRLRRLLPNVKATPELGEPLAQEADAVRTLRASGFELNVDPEGFVTLATSTATSLADEAFRPLAELARLRFVACDSSSLTDAALACLANSADLSGLELPNAHVSDRGLAYLSRKQNLVRLLLRAPGVTDDGLAALANQKSLKSLALRKMTLVGNGLVHPKGCAALKYLDLSESLIQNGALKHLEHLTSVEHLELSNATLTDAELVQLPVTTKLKTIGLRGTRVTDQGFLYVRRVPSLQSINVTGTSVTNKAVETLLETLSNCRVSR